MAQGIKEKGKLGFPSTIYKLCKEAGVPLREFRRTKNIQAEKSITARRVESYAYAWEAGQNKGNTEKSEEEVKRLAEEKNREK
ncbi:hypothetical protein PIB30_095361 [Stylosanthes scabra]|uniref:Uncharacterized protein n=1 Tax=Stylosanthes scabra TaxID=79078 RepID=A0ABU6QVN9_9FABA|nr:hypothetical protein [Stylosanthes scabra]